MAASADDLDADGGILTVETVQIRQQELAGHRVAGTDGQMAQLQLVGLGQLGFARLQQADGAAHIFIEHLALRRQRHAAGITGEQAGVQLRFQLLNGLADSGLRNKKGLGRGSDVAGLCHFLEYFVKLQFYGHRDTSLEWIIIKKTSIYNNYSKFNRNCNPKFYYLG